jgi:hypothetical protein
MDDNRIGSSYNYLVLVTKRIEELGIRISDFGIKNDE